MGTFLNTTGIGLGDYVEDTVHGHRGRVKGIDFICDQDARWRASQDPPLPESDYQVGAPWFSIECDGGGAVYRPGSVLVKVKKFDLVNDWVDEYWPKGKK